ncbi:MAG: hypothetical protein ACREA9_28795 [Pyrinomonadaceae bacterium]
MAKIEDDLNDLFKLPLNEFIRVRKTLAAQLKKSGHGTDAERVKLLAKPSVSAWTVNQLYWNHRDAFDELLASGQHFRKAQTSGKVAEMRVALDARREALAHLSELATEMLSDLGSNPSLDTVRRITSTLEAVSASASLAGATLGRLTKDVDPPGFESFASFTGTSGFTGTAGVPPAKAAPARVQSPKSKAPSPKLQSQISEKKTQVEKSRQQKLAAAKVSLQNAKRSLTEARARAQSLESQQKKADARAKEAEKRQREAEKESRAAAERFKQASSRAEDASQAAFTVKGEVEEAKQTLADAQRTVEKTTSELESLFRSTR